MTKIDVTLSDSEEGRGTFHDWRYTNDLYGGSHNVATLEVFNASGNSIEVEIGRMHTDMATGEHRVVWRHTGDFEAVRIRICGAFENADLLDMLQLVLSAERMAEVIKP